MINIIPFEKWHLQQLKLQPHEQEMLDNGRFLSTVTASGNDCRACFYDGKLLGIGGYLTLWPGVLEIFVVPSVYVFEYPIVVYKTIFKSCLLLKSMPNIHRLQTGVLDDPRRVKFMKQLGFVEEGRMNQYTKSKEDYLMMAWVKK